MQCNKFQTSPVDMNSTKELRRLQFYGAGPKLAGMPEFLSENREDIREALSGVQSSEPGSSELESEMDEISETSSVASQNDGQTKKPKWKNRRAAVSSCFVVLYDTEP